VRPQKSHAVLYNKTVTNQNEFQWERNALNFPRVRGRVGNAHWDALRSYSGSKLHHLPTSTNREHTTRLDIINGEKMSDNKKLSDYNQLNDNEIDFNNTKILPKT
jgi:hypothetical protein